MHPGRDSGAEKSVVLRMLAHVQQATLEPLLRRTIAPGAVVYTATYDIYARLPGYISSDRLSRRGRVCPRRRWRWVL